MRLRQTPNRSIIALLIIAGIFARIGQAQLVPPEELEGIPNHSYAVFVGTGYYRLDDRRLLALSMPFSWQIRDPEAEPRRLGVKLLLPMALGITNFEKVSDFPDLDIDDLATFSFVPGVQIDYPVTTEWTVKPFAQAGLGWDLQSSGSTFVWGGGLRTHYRPEIGETSPWTFGGEYLAAGNNPDNNAPNTRFSRLGLGLEYRHPMRWSLLHRKTFLHTHLVGYYYLTDVEFLPPLERIELGHSVELGVSIGIDPPVKYLGVSLDQLGLGYKYGDELRAITLVASFPF